MSRFDQHLIQSEFLWLCGEKIYCTEKVSLVGQTDDREMLLFPSPAMAPMQSDVWY